MAVSGIGRGRGWLSIKKKPATMSRPETLIGRPGVEIPNNRPDLRRSRVDACPEQYGRLFFNVDNLNAQSDEVRANDELDIVIRFWAIDCPTSDLLRNSVRFLYERSLVDEEFAKKVIAVVCSSYCMKVESFGQQVRQLFLVHMQSSYENRQHLQTSSPHRFRIAVRMLGDFYNRARLSNGALISVLAFPLMDYLRILVESGEPADVQLFATQLCINGRHLRSELPELLDNLVTKVRGVLEADGGRLVEMSRLLLSFVGDYAKSRFSVLPQNVQKLYTNKLGESVMASFQPSYRSLSVNTNHSYKMLDRYESDVSVLQIAPSPIAADSSPAPSSDRTSTGREDRSAVRVQIGKEEAQSSRRNGRQTTTSTITARLDRIRGIKR